MNDIQKWFIVFAVGCISALGMAIYEGYWGFVFTTYIVESDSFAKSSVSNWTGCLLFGILCSSITGFFLFSNKK